MIRSANGPDITLEVPTNPATNALRGVLIDLRRCPHLLHPTVIEYRKSVAHRERLLLVVGHVDECDPDVTLQRLELQLHRLPELEIEGAQRLVEEQDRRAIDQCPRQGHPLPLTTGKLARLPVGEPVEMDHCQCPNHSLVSVPAPSAPSARIPRFRPPSCGGTARSPGTRCSRHGHMAGSRSRRCRGASTVPDVGISKPAIMRRHVVLPLPDGPSIEKNSPSAISSETPSTATTSPNDFATSSSVTAGGIRPISTQRAGKSSPATGGLSQTDGSVTSASVTVVSATDVVPYPSSSG